MAQTKRGAIKCAAARIGVSIDYYDRKTAAGEKWCTRCKAWHLLAAFGRDLSRFDGLTAVCVSARKQFSRERYTPKPRPKPGRKYVAARDGDRFQARGRVNHLVNMGILPDPDERPCIDCGHVAGDGVRHEYDHHLGYAAEHHEHVEVVCLLCHRKREAGRGVYKEVARTRQRHGRHPRKTVAA